MNGKQPLFFLVTVEICHNRDEAGVQWCKAETTKWDRRRDLPRSSKRDNKRMEKFLEIEERRNLDRSTCGYRPMASCITRRKAESEGTEREAKAEHKDKASTV